MPKFITRVELHNASPEDYAKLHDAMLMAKFHKNIVDDNGVSYDLPTAEYSSHGPAITATQVRDLALATANATGRQNWVLVSQYEQAAWSLRPSQVGNGLADLLARKYVPPAPPPNPFANYLTGGPASTALKRGS